MNVTPTDVPGVVVIEPRVFRDERGFFLETFHRRKYAEAGIDAEFVQDNHSRSTLGTIRGLHAQVTRPQGKLVRCVEGRIFDVAVDIRPDSPHFRRWVGAWLSDEDFRQVYVPPGFAHGFCVTSEVAQIEYKCTDFYDPTDEISIQWDDPELRVGWPLAGLPSVVLSDRDRAAKPIRQIMDVLRRMPSGGR